MLHPTRTEREYQFMSDREEYLPRHLIPELEDALASARVGLTAQRYRIRRRIFDTLLKRRIYHRFGTYQFSGMILICFFWGGKIAAEIERG